MKKLLIYLSVIFVISLSVIAQEEVRTSFYVMNTPVTALAATSTNTTAGAIFPIANAQTPIRIWVSASGVAADTDGTGALTIKFSTASGNASVTNAFDTAAYSQVRLVLSNGMATATLAVPVVKSDWFVNSGVRYIRVGQMENTYAGAVSNITVNIGWNH